LGASGEVVGDASLIETIAAGIAHEVRNPLNALQINLGILEQELAELLPDRRHHAFEVIGKIAGELRSLDDFVTEFLRFARPPRLNREPLAVRTLLADLVNLLAPEAARRDVTLSLAAEDGPERVLGDGFQLKHALLNLVLNALQATAPGGAVALEAGGAAGHLEIRVRDSGEGMDPQTLARATDAFFTTREGGTGLGLAITRRIVEAHDGELALESAKGVGTVARLRLPALAGGS
jgi:signal transduction histidine kinase